jgi:sulfur relay (sulfurtransferase) DsrF/TusC family protein
MNDMEWERFYEEHVRKMMGDQHPDVLYQRNLDNLKKNLDELKFDKNNP